MRPGMSRPCREENTNIQPRYGEAAGYLHYLTEQRWMHLGMEGGQVGPTVLFYWRLFPNHFSKIGHCHCLSYIPTSTSFSLGAWKTRHFPNSFGIGKGHMKGTNWFWVNNLLPVFFSFRGFPNEKGSSWGEEKGGVSTEDPVSTCRPKGRRFWIWWLRPHCQW